jgi:hypothetical protein
MEWDLYPLEPILADEDSRKNWALLKELQLRGHYVQAIGDLRAGKIDYLIVTTAPPCLQGLNKTIDRISN